MFALLIVVQIKRAQQYAIKPQQYIIITTDDEGF